MYRGGLLLLPLYISTLSLSACHEGTAKQKEPVMKVHSSPTEVFDAYRQAYRSGDWRTVYFMSTSEVQRNMVYEAEFVCVAAKDPAIKAIQKVFSPTEGMVGKRYWEEYKRKHGHAEVIDKCLAKAIPYWELKDKGAGGTEAGQAGTAPPPPECAAMDALPKDEELFRQALYDATKDKVGFIAEVQKLDRKRRKPDIIGDLEQVTIKDDTATGQARITGVPQPGESPRKPGQAPAVYEKPFKFRKVSGGWLLDSL